MEANAAAPEEHPANRISTNNPKIEIYQSGHTMSERTQRLLCFPELVAWLGNATRGVNTVYRGVNIRLTRSAQAV